MRLDPASTPLKLVLLTVLDLCLHVVDILQYTEGERPDAAVVGSGNKAIGKSSLLTF